MKQQFAERILDRIARYINETYEGWKSYACKVQDML